MDIRSTNGVNDHLKALERKGYLTRGEQQSRSLVPTKRARLVLGLGAPRRDPEHDRRAAAGPGGGRRAAARAARTSKTRCASTASCSAATGKRCSRCGSKGDSMIDDGIHDGDYLFVRKTPSARAGRDRGGADRRRGHGEALLPRGRPHPLPAGEQGHGSPSTSHKSEFKQTMILGQVVGVYRKVH